LREGGKGTDEGREERCLSYLDDAQNLHGLLRGEALDGSAEIPLLVVGQGLRGIEAEEGGEGGGEGGRDGG